MVCIYLTFKLMKTCNFLASNLYCLDKNYGGVLIIWDRIFGTFAKEQKEEEIIYGLVFNQPSFNIFHLQVVINMLQQNRSILFQFYFDRYFIQYM